MADIKDLYDKISQLIEIQGYNEYLERAETLYYDESGNDKHLIIKRDMLNTNYDAVFVLGTYSGLNPFTFSGDIRSL